MKGDKIMYLFKNENLRKMQGGKPSDFETIKEVLHARLVLVDKNYIHNKLATAVVKKQYKLARYALTALEFDNELYLRMDTTDGEAYKPIDVLRPQDLKIDLEIFGHENATFKEVRE